MNLADALSQSSGVRENIRMQMHSRLLGIIGRMAMLACTAFILSPTPVMAQACGGGGDCLVEGNLLLHKSSATAGNVLKEGALFIHDFGSVNTFIGGGAGNLTMTGSANTVMGNSAFSLNLSGGSNTVSGYSALFNNLTGNGNTAIGTGALYSNTSGNNNTAVGASALTSQEGSPLGDGNIAIGAGAGSQLDTGSNNIYVGNPAPSFPAVESQTIRIGTDGIHTRFFAAGVRATAIANDAAQVFIDSSGQLGTLASSEQFKERVKDMGEITDGLMRLRPVTFYYKGADKGPSGLLQYGLIAEEVAKVYPELVQYSESGQPLSVRYHLLSAMLLNVIQRQQHVIEQSAAEIAKLAEQATETATLKARVEVLERLVKGDARIQ